MPKHIYLSPHLDDAVFSCGGLILQQSRRGESVLVLTICAGDPPTKGLSPFAQELHARWKETKSPVELRRQEDQNACDRIGASTQYFDIPESIYRGDGQGQRFYPTEESIFDSLEVGDEDLIDMLASKLLEIYDKDTFLYVPSCYRGHVDHRLTRGAAEQTGLPLYYYRDLPYAARGYELPPGYNLPPGVETLHSIDDAEIEIWALAIMEYASQMSTFWSDEDPVISELLEINNQWGGTPILHAERTNLS